MRICLDISQIVYGTGVSRYTQNLVENLLKLDTDHQFVLFAGSLRRHRQLQQMIESYSAQKKIFPLPPKLLHLLWNTLHLIPLETFTGPLDLVHTSDWAEPPVRKALKVTTIHDLALFKDPQYAPASIRRTHRKKLFWVQKEVQKIIAPSQATKKDIVEYLNIKPERITVIYEDTTLTGKLDFSPAQQQKILSQYAIEKPFILIPGAGHPRKNIARQIKAFQAAKLPHQLVIFGTPSDRELKLQSSQVNFLGFVPQKHLPLLYQKADLVLYASLYEGFGLPILDAFVSRTPLVTSNTSSLPEVAGPAAVLVDPQEVASIQAGIIKALDQSEELVEKGLKQRQKFSWHRTAQRTLQVYQQVYQKNQ